MNAQIIYEATDDIHPFTLPFISICLFFIMSIVYIIKTWKNAEGIVGKILFLFIPIGLSIVIITQISDYFEVKQVLTDFQNGKCNVAEGIIENYEEDYKVGTRSEGDYPDRFFVDGTEFIIHKDYSAFGVGYYWRQSDGSKLREGQYVRITYSFTFYNNIILKVELIEKDTPENNMQSRDEQLDDRSLIEDSVKMRH